MDHFLMAMTRTHNFGMCLTRRLTTARSSHGSTTIKFACQYLSSEPRVHTHHIRSHTSPRIYPTFRPFTHDIPSRCFIPASQQARSKDSSYGTQKPCRQVGRQRKEEIILQFRSGFKKISLSAFTRHSSQRLLHHITMLGSPRSPPSPGSAKPSRVETGFHAPSRRVKLGTAQRGRTPSGGVNRMVAARYHAGIISVQQDPAPMLRSDARLSLYSVTCQPAYITSSSNMHYIPFNDRQERFLFHPRFSKRASERAGGHVSGFIHETA
ncbi:hypothetical protein BDZ85DRAFT_88609 [Elsinoe ampelina]|uniref:Uncharacterized protein n=1 Tax=Elsinoe ampelina TaxID=302913 RepID=A0A6A6GI08_9PEZI|nr:hypothetical protein BDZ85DRAFT_88609 [Elsinoe ampelina]